ncbi:UDP-N-acetylmuramoyl-L-alanyl-D-glutamate--2,6-diaminopimelate ligase [Ferruginivarius sediminum]|nr:UDP-N-acetylmuramoyl-L-alanyl-D-glutamate--2,6-diaminopimelate ligase [Ferruginivarius sediminum]
MTTLETARDIEIRGITADSRQVSEGVLFAAIPGTRADGRDFIPDALKRGAAAVLAPTGTRLPEGTSAAALVTDDNPRRALSLMAAHFHGAQPAFIAAVTGTNGKTSVAAFCRQLWAGTGEKAASLGTMGLVPEVADNPGKLTTPDPVALHRCLAQLAEQGYDRLAIEASSHGLHQYRLDGLKVRAAAFTNLSLDHLDYHGDMASYLGAKRRLFADLLETGGTAVLNADAPESATLAETCGARGITAWQYGEHDGSDIQLAKREPELTGQRLTLSVFGATYRVRLPLVGRFQAMNALAALGLVLASGMDREAAIAGLESLEGAPGRLQRVAETPVGAQVFVDYAHTPDALQTVLEALRPHVAGRLIVVFGCGGDRDRGKRPVMGGTAARLADKAIVTDDNPRSEDPAAIRREILESSPGAVEVGDRGAAIDGAIADLAAGDVLLIAGKGHETGQIVGETILPFDDAERARAAIAQIKAGGDA